MTYDLEGRAVYPLSDLFQSNDLPLADMVPSHTVSQVFGGLYYTEAQAYSSGDGWAFNLHLAFQGELALTPPGTQAISLVIGDTAGGWTVIETRIVIGPEASIAMEVPVTLRFARDVLRDITTDGPAEITFAATLELSSNGDLTLDTDATLSLAECEVAGSGVTISASGVTWNFEHGATLTEAAAAGISGEFIGIALQQVMVKLPPEIAGAPLLTLDYCCIGTGGFTGGVTTTFAAPPSCQIAGFTVELERVGIRFQESRLVSGEIAGLVKKLGFFDTDLAVDLQLSAGGLRVVLAASPDRQTDPNASVSNGLVTLHKPGLIAMTVTAAELLVTPTAGAIRLSGAILPLVAVPGAGALPGFMVEALRIASTGEVSVEGGWINLPKLQRVALGPFGLELTRVGLGTEPNGERWLAFSGGLDLAEGIPVSAALDGLKIRWDANGLTGIELSGVKLELSIEGVLHLKGEVRYNAAGQRFDGAGTLQLISLNLTVSVRIVIGRRADYTYFYLYLLVAPPVGVPIFNTGLAFYGLEALYARNMAPDKQAEERWYQDWYQRPQLGATDQTKWADIRGGQAFGAGVILGTLPDRGYGVAVKGLLILVLPGPMLLLDARANLLRDPSALALPGSQALFNALAVYDEVRGTLELGIETHYVFPAAGELIDIIGMTEAFYSFSDPRAWHVYLGQRERERRIRARILSLFDANAYVMLEPDRLELGAFIGYDADYRLGPARLVLQAYIEGSGLVSWRPKQLKGDLHLQGGIALTVAGVGLDLQAFATVEVQAPQPFRIDAEVAVRANLPWPIPDLEATVGMHWEAPGQPRITAPLQSLAIVHPQTTATWSLDSSEPVIPLDGRPALAFEGPVNDLAQIGENRLAARERTVGDYTLRADLSGIELLVEQNGTWVPFATTGGTPRTLFGAWQTQAGDSSQGNRRLILWTRTPYESSRSVTETSIAQLVEAERFSPCDPVGDAILVDFDEHLNEVIPPHMAHVYRTITWTPGRMGGAVLEVTTAIGGRPIAQTMPRPYYRCLTLPDQFGYVPVGEAPLGTGTPASSVAPPASQPALRIEFPADITGITVLVLASGGWSLRAFDASGGSLGMAQTAQPQNMPFPNGEYRPMQLTARGANIRRVDLDCTHRLAVLVIAVQEAVSATEHTARRAAIGRMLNRYKSVEPVLEPHRRYKLRVTTSVVEPSGKSLVGANVESPAGTQTIITGSACTCINEFTFRTEGPPGDTALSPIGAAPEATSGLDTLETYIQEVLPPRGAQTAYRAYDVHVLFNADYVSQMYLSNNQLLVIELRSDQGNIVTTTNVMGPGHGSVLRREDLAWLSILAQSSCQLTIAPSVITRGSTTGAQILANTPLQPRRRYDAILRGQQPGKTEAGRPLYQWSFVSSAFLNFTDHFKLADRVRTAPLTAADGAQWLAAAASAISTGDPWLASANERTRRRVLEIQAFETMIAQVDITLALPEAVELTALVAGGTTWAMLLSSPEPFDWDRVRLDIIRQQRPFVADGWLTSSLTLMRRIFGVARQPSAPTLLNVKQELRVLRDADGTRALLLAMIGSRPVAVVPANYSLTGTFKRDASAAGLPILTESGSAADEQATIQWTLPAT
jgi:hypothetical protein